MTALATTTTAQQLRRHPRLTVTEPSHPTTHLHDLTMIYECPSLFARLEVLNISENPLTDRCVYCLSIILENCKGKVLSLKLNTSLPNYP
ncbi:hypothetical protein DVH24_020760 [Malus domestica]|uniref:Uncharacterized protein n=1 Tax=Malus domestica TaxID=3750 RepID=A0A498JAF8_MALDO|nr:hypothetical protein DVH24_020760 [Malus domestica]